MSPTTHHVCAFTPAPSPESAAQNPIYKMLQSPNVNRIFVLVALEHMSPKTGLYTFLYGSHGPLHPRFTPVSAWNTGNAEINLSAGDAIIYRGDISYMLSRNGGGMFEILVYDWGLEVVDLTKDGRSKRHSSSKNEDKFRKRHRHERDGSTLSVARQERISRSIEEDVRMDGQRAEASNQPMQMSDDGRGDETDGGEEAIQR